MGRLSANSRESTLCLHSCDPNLRDALLLVLDSLSSKVPPVETIVGLQTYAGIVRDYDPSDIFQGVRVPNRLDSLAPGMSHLSEVGLLLALAYVLRGRGLAEAVRQAALQSGTLLSMPVEIEVEDPAALELTVNVEDLIDQRAGEHGFSREVYLRFLKSGAIVD